MSIVWTRLWDEPGDDGRTLKLVLAVGLPSAGGTSGFFWSVRLDRLAPASFRSVEDGTSYDFSRLGYAQACRQLRRLSLRYRGPALAVPECDAISLIHAAFKSEPGLRDYLIRLLGRTPEPEAPRYADLVGVGPGRGRFAF